MPLTRITSRTWVTGIPNSSRSSAKVRRCSIGARALAPGDAIGSVSAKPSKGSTVARSSVGIAGSVENPYHVENAGHPPIAQNRGAGDHGGPPQGGIEALHHDVLVPDEP